ncbi:DUF3139 domain-containing protein [Solibacillus silvestris]|uniref:DUF3139 domain-containing protein n=1 Tax=Solibacillus silvestris TaxID=76853 RepID=UPI003F7DF31E
MIGLIVLIMISPILYVQINKVMYASKVSDYLIEEKGYKKEEIKSIEGVWGKKLPAFYVVVIFKNEPNIEYTYFAHSGVGQFEFRAVDGKEITTDELTNYDPKN